MRFVRGDLAGTPLARLRRRRVDQQAERAIDQQRQLVGQHHRVDDAAIGEVLGGLHAGRERPALHDLVDLGPEEADQGAGLGDRDVRQRSPRGEDAAGRRVTQIDQVGQARRAVVHDRAGDVDHVHERGGALLHAGAAGRGRRQQRYALGGRPADGGHDPVGRGLPDRSGEEAELVDEHGHGPAVHQAAAGQHGLVGAGPLGRCHQLLLVRRVEPGWSTGASHDSKEPASSTRSSRPCAVRWAMLSSQADAVRRLGLGVGSVAGGLGLGRHEAIADVADRADERLVVGAELGAQTADVDVDRACAAEVVVAPDLLQQLLAGEDPAGVLGEELEELELLEREVEGAVLELGGVGRVVDDEAARGDDVALVVAVAGRGDAADAEPQASLELGGAGGGEDDVVHAPVGRGDGEAAFGQDQDQRALDAGGADDAGQAAHLGEVVAAVDEDGVARRRVEQGAGLGREDLDVVGQQRERGQHLDRGLRALGEQEQVGHVSTSGAA